MNYLCWKDVVRTREAIFIPFDLEGAGRTAIFRSHNQGRIGNFETHKFILTGLRIFSLLLRVATVELLVQPPTILGSPWTARLFQRTLHHPICFNQTSKTYLYVKSITINPGGFSDTLPWSDNWKSGLCANINYWVRCAVRWCTKSHQQSQNHHHAVFIMLIFNSRSEWVQITTITTIFGLIMIK